MDDEAPRPTSGPVTAAVALGCAPLPFLAIYTVLFIAHGTVHPVNPPDIGNSQRAELWAGLIALGLLIVGVLTIAWYLNRRWRWPFAAGQAATLGVSIWFLVDTTTGPPAVPAVLGITSLVALVIALLPVSAEHVAHGWVQTPDELAERGSG